MDHAQEYPSRRSPVFARNVVATSQPLAAQAGLRMLQDGGNAIDAALATAMALAIVEPTMNGIGSDLFAMIWDGEALHGLNASGRSPGAWTPSRFAGRERMPTFGIDAVTVPGAVSGWVAASERFGRLPFERLFEPAIEYARNGFVVPPKIAKDWALAEKPMRSQPGFAEHFLPRGRALWAGETFRSPFGAETLETIAVSRGEAFYRGVLADAIVACSEACGGALSLDDFGAHRADWVEPLTQRFGARDIHELPPNSQGICTSMALGILEHLDLASTRVDSADSIHLQAEAIKLAGADTKAAVADLDHMELTPDVLLDSARLAERAATIDRRKALPMTSALRATPSTVLLTAADAGGRMVTLIQSNYLLMGSGVVVPGTGIALQNRASDFETTPGRANSVGPSKRPFHTLMPGFATRDGAADMAFGVKGGPMQPQGHVQLVVRCETYDQNPQTAIDAPRFFVRSDGALSVEAGFARDVLDDLAARGHEIVENETSLRFGGAQAIARLDDGYCAGSDPRRDGCAVGF